MRLAAQNGVQVAGRVTGAGPRWLEDSSRDFGKGKWRYVRIVSGRAAGPVAHVRHPEDSRLVIGRSWDLRGEGAAAAVRAARESQADTMPIWFDVPDETSRYVAVEDSRTWLNGTGEECPVLIAAGELLRDRSLAAARECS